MWNKRKFKILLLVGLVAASISAVGLSFHTAALADDPSHSPTPSPDETSDPEEPPQEDPDGDEDSSEESVEDASHGWDDPDTGVRIHWTKPQSGPLD